MKGVGTELTVEGMVAGGGIMKGGGLIHTNDITPPTTTIPLLTQ